MSSDRDCDRGRKHKSFYRFDHVDSLQHIYFNYLYPLCCTSDACTDSQGRDSGGCDNGDVRCLFVYNRARLTMLSTTSYITKCPVTETVTEGGSTNLYTGLSTSTVYSTYTSTICTKCVAPSTPAPTVPAKIYEMHDVITTVM